MYFLQYLFESSPGGVVLALIVALVVSGYFRRKPWVVFVWAFPVIIFTLVAVRVMQIFMHGRISENGMFTGAVMFVMLLLLMVSLLGLWVCYFFRPRKEAWRLSIAVTALLLFPSLLWLGAYLIDSRVTLQIVDGSGQPLSGVRVKIEQNGRTSDIERQEQDTGADGLAKFTLRRESTVEVELTPLPSTPTWNGEYPANLRLRIQPREKSHIEVRYVWDRWIGDRKIWEGFAELLPRGASMELKLILPPRGSFGSAPQKEKIRVAMEALRASMPDDFDYGRICRNVESVDFIPELIEIYRREPSQRVHVVKGLSQIAEILSDMDEGCLGLQRRHYSDSREEIKQLYRWAGVPEGEDLVQVRQKIKERTEPLLDFILTEMPTYQYTMTIAGELRGLATPAVSRVVAYLQANPPTEMQDAMRWGHTLRMMKAREEDLRPLLNSENEILRACGKR